jgi:transcriptional regulator with XRE-family HTH domain
MDEPIAKVRRRLKKDPYDPAPFIERIEELRTKRNLSLRQAGMQAGLDHQAFRRMKAGARPDITYCILLADFFEVNPNELLLLAGWPRLKVFDVASVSEENLPPEAVDVALALAKIADTGTRKEVAEAVMVLLKKYFD